LLWRRRRSELNIEIEAVVSNWPDLEDEVARFGLPYHCVPVTRETEQEAEARQLALICNGRHDLIVLARYMQVLSGKFLTGSGCPIIDIHHSFLPRLCRGGPV
jgi:formyltetrahydrofolate deformylase